MFDSPRPIHPMPTSDQPGNIIYMRRIPSRPTTQDFSAIAYFEGLHGTANLVFKPHIVSPFIQITVTRQLGPCNPKLDSSTGATRAAQPDREAELGSSLTGFPRVGVDVDVNAITLHGTDSGTDMRSAIQSRGRVVVRTAPTRYTFTRPARVRFARVYSFACRTSIIWQSSRLHSLSDPYYPTRLCPFPNPKFIPCSRLSN
jgi:hypothetical protein